MKKTVFLYSGEGTNNSASDFKLLKHSPYWSEIQHILNSKLDLDLEEIWKTEIGKHRCPYSPLITAVSQICLSDIWIQWGYKPDIVLGHSIGELAAAYQAGLYSLEEATFGDVSFTDVMTAPPKNGPPKEAATMSYEALIEEIEATFWRRNNPPIEWAE